MQDQQGKTQDESGKESEPGPSRPDERWPDSSQSIEDLKATSERIKDKIVEEKRRHDLPLDSTLGDPNWDERAKDGHLDRPDDEED